MRCLKRRKERPEERGESRWQGTERQSKRSDKKIPKNGKVIKNQHLPREEETMRDDMKERSGKALIFYLSVLSSSPPSLSGQLCKFFIFSFPPCTFFGYLGAPAILPLLLSYIFNMHSSSTRSDVSYNNKLPHQGCSPPLFHPFSSITAPQSSAAFV